MTGIQLSDKIVPYGDFDMVDASRVSGGSGNTLDTDCLADSGVTAGSYTTTNITVDSKGRITAASTGVGGVKSDWSETDSNSLAFIENKPTIPSGNQIIDWTASGAGTIHASNYTNTTYSVQDGELSQNNFTNALKSKLDGIANNATADQTDAEIRAAVAAATDSNVYTDALNTKLNGIATSANNYSISSDLLDEDNMATNSDTKVPSQQSVKAYVDNNTTSLWTNSFGDHIYRSSGNVAVGNVNSPGDRLIVRGSAHQRIKLETTANNKEATIGFEYYASGSTNEWCIGRKSTGSFVIAKSADLTDNKLILDTGGNLSLFGTADFGTLKLNSSKPGIIFTDSSVTGQHIIGSDTGDLQFLYDVNGNDTFDSIYGSINASGYWLITNRMKIGSSSVNPSYTLDVDGDINLTGQLRVSGTAISFFDTTATTTISGNLNFTSVTNPITTASIKLVNSENTTAYYIEASGVLAFDENFHADLNYGDTATSPKNVFDNNGGGLVIKNEDGWGAVYSTTNSQFANPTFKSMILGGTTETEKNAISSPVEGHLIYDTTASSPQIYMGSSWRKFLTQSSTGDYFFQGGSDVTVFNGDLQLMNSSGSIICFLSPTIDCEILKNLTIGENSINRLKIGQIDGLTSFGCVSHDDRYNSTDYGFGQDTNGGTRINAASGQKISFRINNSQKMVVSGGNVGVGTSSPTNKFHCNGTLRLNQLRQGNNVMSFYQDHMSTNSDAELKTNVKQIDNALAKIEKIGGYTFNWTREREEELIKDKISKIAKVGEQADRLQEEYDEDTQIIKTVGSVSDEDYKKEYDQRIKHEKAKIRDINIGVIAQEVLEIAPEIVDMRDGNLIVAYDKLCPLLIESIKELSEKLKILEGKIK